MPTLDVNTALKPPFFKQGEEFKEEVKQSNTEETKEFAMYKDEQGRVQSKKKSNKKGKKEEGKKGLMAIYDDDVHVADVLSYRYIVNEFSDFNQSLRLLINFYLSHGCL